MDDRDPDWKIQNPRCGCEGPCVHEGQEIDDKRVFLMINDGHNYPDYHEFPNEELARKWLLGRGMTEDELEELLDEDGGSVWSDHLDSVDIMSEQSCPPDRTVHS